MTSAWVTSVTIGVSRQDRCIRSAMVRRIEVSGTTVMPASAGPDAAGTAASRPLSGDSAVRRTSSLVTSPPGPVPSTRERSTPSSWARLRATGETWRRPAGFPGALAGTVSTRA